MVMDLVTGGELFDAVAKEGKLAEARARLYFQQLVDGIHYCHTRRVYHRDLKPENLLLSGDKQTIKITDFGLSSIKAPDCSTELLHTIMGSPHYIAPEIITSAAAGYDGAKVDVWASGIILFGMLAGYLPFDEPITRDLYHSIVQAHVSFPPHFSYDVIKLLRAMLQKDPKKRPTMDEVKNFTWFKVNYRPACTEDDDPASPSSRSKKLRYKHRKSVDRKSSERKSSERKSSERRSIDRRSVERPRSSRKRDTAPTSVQDTRSISSTSTSSQPKSAPLSSIPPFISTTSNSNQPPRLPPPLSTSDFANRNNPTAMTSAVPTAIDTAGTRDSSTTDSNTLPPSDGSHKTSSTQYGDVSNHSSFSRAAPSTISADLSSKDMTTMCPDYLPSPISGEHFVDSGHLFTYVDTPIATSRGHYPKNGFSRNDNSTSSSSGPRSTCVTFSSTPQISPLPSPSTQQEPYPVPPTLAVANMSIKSPSASDSEQAPFAKMSNIEHAQMFISPVSVASDADFTPSDNPSYPPSRPGSVHDGHNIQENVTRLSVDVLDDDVEVMRQTSGMGPRTETASSFGSEERKPIGIFKPVKSLFQALIPEKATKLGSASSDKAKVNSHALNDDWCIDSGDAFADVETDGASMRWQEPRQSSQHGRFETGSLKFLADLRRRQSLSSDAPPPSFDRSLEKSEVGSKDKDDPNGKTIFSALNTNLALKLSPSQESTRTSHRIEKSGGGDAW